MARGSLRIGIVGRWGAACGISLHVELVSNALRAMGHSVTVYAPTLETAMKDWHHVVIEGDPGFVRRVYGEVDELEYPGGGFFDGEGLEENDVVIVEGYPRLPWLALRRYLEEARKAGVRVGLVVHYMFPREVEPLLDYPWDAILVFDERFEGMIREAGEPPVDPTIVPYPHMTLEVAGAERPDYAEGRLLLFSFGRQPAREYIDYLLAARRLWEAGRRLVYRIVRSLDDLRVSAPWVVVEEARPSHEEVYRMLRGADIHLLPKWDHPGVVVSSTLAQVMYAGVATVVPDTRYFETIPDYREGGPLVKYRLGNVRMLVGLLEELAGDEGLRRELGERARRYAWERRAEVVAAAILKALAG